LSSINPHGSEVSLGAWNRRDVLSMPIIPFNGMYSVCG